MGFSIGNLGGGVIGDTFGALTGTIDAGTGGWWSDQSTKKSAKRNYKYNSWLQKQNKDFQKYMAMNAHQLEMMDLQEAGLNPALTATGSSAGSIAGSSSAQGTSPGQAVDTLMNIVDGINAMRTTNANIENQGKQADAALKNADANMLNAQTNAQTAGTGFTGRWLGNKYGIKEGIDGWNEVAKRADKKLNNWIDKQKGKIRHDAGGKGYYSKSMLLGE